MAFDGWGTELRERVHALNDRRLDGGRYVLLWLQQALRAHDNPAVDAAVELANAHDLPVVAYHGLRMDYPHASDRIHRFILGLSRDLERDLEARGIRCATYLETAEHREKGLVYRLAKPALAVVTDEQHVFVARWQARSFAAKVDRPVFAIDANRLVPTRILPRDIRGTSAFRKTSGAERDRFLEHAADYEPAAPRYDDDLGFDEAHNAKASAAELDARIAACAIDHTLPPVKEFPASRHAALDRMAEFAATDLADYAYKRNNPADEDSVSRLSPYIHFGAIGPRELTRAARESDHKSNPKWKFADELLTWREWFHYLTFQAAEAGQSPEAYEHFVVAQGRKTLEEHADDPREVIYTLCELLHGETDDETWNASQRQWLTQGYMHNNLRMYWSKQVIRWTESPRAAWITACYINDRLSLDGRDPSTYGNMQSTFGRGKPAYSEQPVLGWVAPKTDRPVRKRPGAPEWLARMAKVDTPRIAVPDAAFVARDFEEIDTA